jgi:hypothetical protein
MRPTISTTRRVPQSCCTISIFEKKEISETESIYKFELVAYVLSVRSPPKPAGLDVQIFADRPQIGCGSPLTKKNYKKI